MRAPATTRRAVALAQRRAGYVGVLSLPMINSSRLRHPHHVHLSRRVPLQLPTVQTSRCHHLGGVGCDIDLDRRSLPATASGSVRKYHLLRRRLATLTRQNRNLISLKLLLRRAHIARGLRNRRESASSAIEHCAVMSAIVYRSPAMNGRIANSPLSQRIRACACMRPWCAMSTTCLRRSL